MKKLLFLLLLFAIPIRAQIVDGFPVSANNPMPVKFEAAQSVTATISGNVTTVPIADTAFIWASDTLTSATDTVIKYAYYTLVSLNTMFKQYYRLTVTADSSIDVSTSASFTSGLSFYVKTGESWTPPHVFNPAVFTQLYIRRHTGITGTVTWRIEVSGR